MDEKCATKSMPGGIAESVYKNTAYRENPPGQLQSDDHVSVAVTDTWSGSDFGEARITLGILVHRRVAQVSGPWSLCKRRIHRDFRHRRENAEHVGQHTHAALVNLRQHIQLFQ